MFDIILLTIFYLLFVILSWKKPVWAVYLTLVSLPLYVFRFHLGSIPMTFLEGMILLLFVVFLIKSLRQKKPGEVWKKIYTCPFFGPGVLLLVAATVSVFVSPDIKAALGIWKAYFIEPILFMIVVANVIKDKKQFRNMIWSLGIAGAWISILGVVQYLTGLGIPAPWHEEGARRITSLYEYPNAVGLFLAPVLTLLLGIIITQVKFFKPKNIWWFILIILLALFAVLASVSEGAWLAIAAGVTFCFLFTRFRKIFLVLLVVLVLLVFAIPQARDYVLPIITFQDVSGDVRLVMWQGTWNLLKARPFEGAGLAGFSILYEQFRLIKHTEFLMYPHNILLNFWAETGLIGLIAIVWIIIKYFWEGIKLIKAKVEDYQYAIILMGVMVAILVYGIVDAPYFKNDLSVMFWLWLVMLVLVGRLSRSEANK